MECEHRSVVEFLKEFIVNVFQHGDIGFQMDRRGIEVRGTDHKGFLDWVCPDCGEIVPSAERLDMVNGFLDAGSSN